MNNNFENQENIFELAAILSLQTDYSEILRVVSTKTASIFNADVVSIVMINPKTQETLKTVIEERKEIEREHFQLTQNLIIGWMMRNKESFLSDDLGNDSRFNKDLFGDDTVKSAVCVPLKYQGKNIGYILVLNRKQVSEFNNESIKLLEYISDITAPHISNVQKLQDYFNVSIFDNSILHKYRQFGLLGKSRSFIELLKSIEAAARCDVRVVLEGQTGTGKELIAIALHKLSQRSEHPFVAIDCGAIPHNLMESELFGHVRGAFTDANRDRTGLIVEANKGTLFLDEVNNLSKSMQSKLLRAIQEGKVRPVGSNRTIKVDVRIISASSISLLKLIEEEEFRRDLYFRLMVYPIYIPPLSERKSDIPILVEYFLNKFASEQKKAIDFFHSDIIEYLKAKKWYGNIRELENFVERLVTLAPENAKLLEVTSLPSSYSEEINKFILNHKSQEFSPLKESLKKFETDIILNTLEQNDWNQNKTARSLNILEQTLRAKMKKLEIIRHK